MRYCHWQGFIAPPLRQYAACRAAWAQNEQTAGVLVAGSCRAAMGCQHVHALPASRMPLCITLLGQRSRVWSSAGRPKTTQILQPTIGKGRTNVKKHRQ